jgi:flagellar M-ring protein FliF
LGRGNFRVSADADIDFSHTQESSVKYGESHILSQDETVHSHSGNSELAIGIPGALSNRPPVTPTIAANPPPSQTAAAPPAAPPLPPATTEPPKPESPPPPDTHRTTNFDIDRTVQASEHPGWKLRAINVDVLINNPSRNPIPAGRVQSIEKLVSSSVGSGENRRITVVDLPFADEGGGGGEASAPWWRQQWMAATAQNAMLGVAGLLVLLGGVLPLLRRSRAHLARAAAETAAAAVASESLSVDHESEARAEPSMRSTLAARPSLVIDTDALRELVANDPARTARVIKEWIARDTSNLRRTG